MFREYSILTFLLIFACFGQATGQNQNQNPAIQNPEIGFTDNTNDYLSPDIELINKHDSVVTLGELIDKPTILTFVYFDCPGICTPLLNEVASLIDKVDLELGKDYQILTVSFDPTEPTRLAQQKKKNLVSTLRNKQQATEGWKFFTARSKQIDKLTEEAGFHYKPQGQEFIHSGGLIAVSPNRKITRYLKGVSFLPFEMKMSIVEAAEGKVGPPINKVLQYCFAYDPEGQTYVADVTKISGIIIIFLAVVLFFILVFRSRGRKNKAEAK
jgi:protein SCO1/2